MTAHGSPKSQSSIAAFGEPKWLTVNAVYSYEKKLYEPILAEYLRKPTRPFVLLESVYEGEHDSTPEEIRRQAYWSLQGGACGQFFGNNPIWHFDGPGLFPTKSTWTDALDGAGSRDMDWLRKTFATLPWHQLEPESDHAIVTKGYGKDLATILTARTPDKKLAVTYVPSTGAASQELTVNLGQFAGPITALWVNPTNGKTTAISDKPYLTEIAVPS
jgi:hypothetical protein